MAVTEEEVKNIIKSILTSTPCVSTITTVQKDYEELVGYKMPFYKFKYNSAEHYLRNVPDICEVRGTGPFARVIPIVTEKSAHINEMVTKQKNNVKKKKPTFNRRQCITNNRRHFNKQAYVPQQGSSKFADHTHVHKSYELNNTIENIPNKYAGVISDNSSKQKESISWHSDNKGRFKSPQHPSPIQKGPMSNAVVQTLQANLSNLSFNNVKEDLDEDSSNVPVKVQNNLKQLIKQFENGIWCSDLPKHYEKMFNINLLYMEYGYPNLIDMCIELTHIFHYVRPGKDDFKLYDREKPLPKYSKKNYTISSFDTDRSNKNNALPKLDWSDFCGYIPGDILAFGMEISKQFLPNDSKEGDVVDVVVVEIYDPSKFWIYIGTSEQKTSLDRLMDEMQLFYNDTDNQKEYSIPSGLIEEGLYCVQVIYGEYHRARIVKLQPDSKEQVRVFFIDYGTVCKVPVKGMCFLHYKFANLPAQAIRCRLANIVPELKHHPWPRSASEAFREMANRRDTKIKISYIDWNEEYVCVFLADITNMDRIIYINELLVKSGHAVWEEEAKPASLLLPNFKCKVQKLHLFPTFLELEYGLVPNAEEMYYLEELLVPIQFCIPHYFEPNDKEQCDEQEDLNWSEDSFIETIKYHRKSAPLRKTDASELLKEPTVDFDYFAELKSDIMKFSTKQTSDVASQSTVESLQIIKEDKELSENIIKKLDMYSFTGNDEASTDVTVLSQSEIIEQELSSVFEETDDKECGALSFNSSQLFDLSEKNIFDNPELFDSAVSCSEPRSPVSPNLFLQIVDTLTKSSPKNDWNHLTNINQTEASDNVPNRRNPFLTNHHMFLNINGTDLNNKLDNKEDLDSCFKDGIKNDLPSDNSDNIDAVKEPNSELKETTYFKTKEEGFYKSFSTQTPQKEEIGRYAQPPPGFVTSAYRPIGPQWSNMHGCNYVQYRPWSTATGHATPQNYLPYLSQCIPFVNVTVPIYTHFTNNPSLYPIQNWMSLVSSYDIVPYTNIYEGNSTNNLN